MRLAKLNRKLFVAGAAISAVVLLPVAGIAATNNSNPQSAPSALSAAAPVPDQCVLQKLLNPDEQKYRLTYNAANTYTTTGVFFNVKCGALTFTVPRGQDALVDFTAAAELDCQAPNNVTTPTPTNGWCESRFLVNTVNVLPNNTERGDTFAWDSSNGGNFDWQANTLEQVGRANCPLSPVTNSPCTFHTQLQARLNNGATSLWVDDLTVRVDVSVGTVTSTTLTP